MADFEDWDMDGGVGNGAGQGNAASGGTPRIRGGLLDPSTFPSPWPPVEGTQITPASDGAPEDEWIERSAPLLKHGLDSDTHAEVLRDILDAQAKLPPSHPPQGVGLAVFDPKRYSTMQAEGFDPARLNGVTSTPSPDMVSLAITGAPTVGVTHGGPEKMTYMVRSSFPAPLTTADVDPHTGLASTLQMKPFVFLPTPGGAPESAAKYDTVGLPPPPPEALAVDHGHRDGISEGFVDAPSTKHPYGDTQSLSLSNPIPTATVSDGQVGWHVLDNGRLKFVYPSGSMTPEQAELMQRNLNDEQKNFLRPR